MSEWFLDSAQNILQVGLSCLIFYIIMLVTSRLAGLRSFTTFSGFDFLITLAMGALLATTITSKEVSITEGTVAIIALYLFQVLIAWARQHWSFVKKWVDNSPVLLMEDGKVLHDNLKHVRITEDELKAKLRQANIHNYKQIKVVVLESSGNISVMHNPDVQASFEPNMLDGVVKDATG